MTYIVHGATGAQGAPVLSRLLDSGLPVTAAVRTPAGVPDGVRTVRVDLGDAVSLAAAYHDAEGVFVHLPLGSPDQIDRYADAIVTAMKIATPRRVVISTSGQIVDDPASPLAADATSPIRKLVDGVRSSGTSLAVVAPRLYLENLLLPVVAGPAQEAGVLRYPLPSNYPVSWSSHADVAEVAVRLLTDTAITGVVSVGHLPALTGDDLASAFATLVGRDVVYEAIDPEHFGTLILPLFGAESTGPVVGLYQALNMLSGHVISADRSAQQLLGVAPAAVAERLAQAVALLSSAGA
ncbi:SDR family oxidoreductase [Microbacterium sp. ZW T5_56]|uniref:SDR family oxidoreductase n=1 Tax=Microbacterium sp. ZW T5_56 TaxID=3378081 RepID=UPI003855128E